MPSVPAPAPFTSVSSSGAIESPKAHSIEWLTAAFRDVDVDARALDAAEIRKIDTDVPMYASAILARVEKLEDMRALMLHHRMPTWGFDNIERYAVVARNANATKPSRRVNPAHREVLAASSRYIATCKTEIGILVARGWVEGSVLDGLPKHASYRNNGVSLMRCALVLKENREHLAASQSKVTEEDIALYIDTAERLSRHGVLRDTIDDMPARTFTLLDTAADEVRAVLAFLLRKTPKLLDVYLPKKVKKAANTKATKAKKAGPKAKEGQPEKVATNKPQTSVGNVQSPTPSANGNVRVPEARNEERAAE